MGKEKRSPPTWGSFGVLNSRMENNLEMYHLGVGGPWVSLKLGHSGNEVENSHLYICPKLPDLKPNLNEQ